MIKEIDQHVSAFNGLMDTATSEVADIQRLVNNAFERINARETAVAKREAALNSVLEQSKKSYTTEVASLKTQLAASLQREKSLQSKLGGTQTALEAAKVKLQKFGLEEKPEVAKAAAEVGH